MTQNNNSEEYGIDYAEWQIRRSNNFFRRLIKDRYVKKAIEQIDGPTIDFGCGAGQILSKLPPGSIGLEVNKSLVTAHQARGINVVFYDAFEDDFSLQLLPVGKFRCMVISHVLEHFPNSAHVMQQLWLAAGRLGVQKIIAIVPGRVGYASDSTHRTFIDAEWIKLNELENIGAFKLKNICYFPLNNSSAGNRFIYNEMHLTYTHKNNNAFEKN